MILVLTFSGAVNTSSPDIETGPQTIFAVLYQAVTLTCIATGNPQPTIAWYRDGSEIPGEGSPFLVIEEVELSDRGVYWCTAVNTEGSVSSFPAFVGVIGRCMDTYWDDMAMVSVHVCVDSMRISCRYQSVHLCYHNLKWFFCPFWK